MDIPLCIHLSGFDIMNWPAKGCAFSIVKGGIAVQYIPSSCITISEEEMNETLQATRAESQCSH
jgi:hypothetical protein